MGFDTHTCIRQKENLVVPLLQLKTVQTPRGEAAGEQPSEVESSTEEQKREAHAAETYHQDRSKRVLYTDTGLHLAVSKPYWYSKRVLGLCISAVESWNTYSTEPSVSQSMLKVRLTGRNLNSSIAIKCCSWAYDSISAHVAAILLNKGFSLFEQSQNVTLIYAM